MCSAHNTTFNQWNLQNFLKTFIQTNKNPILYLHICLGSIICSILMRLYLGLPFIVPTTSLCLGYHLSTSSSVAYKSPSLLPHQKKGQGWMSWYTHGWGHVCTPFPRSLCSHRLLRELVKIVLCLLLVTQNWPARICFWGNISGARWLNG